jgi:hypothetical protein
MPTPTVEPTAAATGTPELEERPGLGCGDRNHIHTGPPGNPDKTCKDRDDQDAGDVSVAADDRDGPSATANDHGRPAENGGGHGNGHANDGGDRDKPGDGGGIGNSNVNHGNGEGGGRGGGRGR